MKKSFALFFLLHFLLLFNAKAQKPFYSLQSTSIPTQWDKALPMGNGLLGALIWQKDNQLRFSLDRADLWDERPMKGLHRKEFSYKWVQEQISKNEYKPVQEYLDYPYDHEPAPSKIPGAAIEFDIHQLGKSTNAKLDLLTATSIIQWNKGVQLKSFVHATEPIGWFKFENIPLDFQIKIIAPKYNGAVNTSGDVVGGDDLSRLGYEQGTISVNDQSITYLQKGWSGFFYKVSIKWKKVHNGIEGVWTITSNNPTFNHNLSDSVFLSNHLNKGFNVDYTTHINWWKNYWNQSSIQVPNELLEKQWFLEQYKFGSTARKGAPPISLQAIWTADNGRLPPWKGDYHHDLNTQLSYWPSYSGNHLLEGMSYLDHLDQNKENYKRYTKEYFGVDGLAVPGVTTLDGTEMGGWIQYSLSPTVSAWLSHHYYLQWRYSMDRAFLQKRAYPWIKDVSKFIENITVFNKNGYRQLPISSSPEINDNSQAAWFHEITNYDLALIKFNLSAAKELANELGLTKEALHWDSLLQQFPAFSLSENNELKFSSTLPYNVSHRHFSHLMAVHPLSLIKWEDGSYAKKIINNTIHLLDSIGPAYWCGYSYSWLANLKSRAKDGEGAATALDIFAKAFCSTNSFHLNGDQSKSGYSEFQYSPFTLEGNFAFAAGLQEMLLQSYAGFIEVMPAVPLSWKDVSFNNLRTEGAFLISAEKKDGIINKIIIESTQGGIAKIKLPFEWYKQTIIGTAKVMSSENGFLQIRFNKGAKILLTSDLSTQKLTLTKNGKSNFTICIAPHADSLEQKAALELKEYIYKISGVYIPIAQRNENKGQSIYIGSSSPEYDVYKKYDYSISSNTNSLSIVGSNSLKTLESVYVFLEEYLGCKFLSPTVEHISEIKNIEIQPNYFYTPKVKTRTIHAKLFYDNPLFAAKRRVTTEGFPGFAPEARVHTFNHFIPEKKYYASNPEFYALVKNKRLPTQLCLSNDTVIQMIKDSVAAVFKRNPASNVVSVSQNDNTQYCTCFRCSAVDEKEGTPAASMLLLVNHIAKAFPDKVISTLAYQYTRKAPKNIRPEKNVLVTLCSIECDRSAPIAEKSKDFKNDLKEWGAIGATIQIWDYTTQFTNFLAPFPNLETIKPNIELFVENNTNWIFEQHSHNVSDLYELRCWLMSKLLWDPTLSYEKLLEEFTNAYYGTAGNEIRQYVDELHKAIKSYPNFFLFLYGDPAQGFDSWMSEERIKKYNSLFDEAYKKANNDEILKSRINNARIGLDFATLEFYRLNKASYSLSDTASILVLMNRFEASARHQKVVIMNEMGLPFSDYIQSYRKLLHTAAKTNLAQGANVVLKNKPVKYAHENPLALTDGVYGGWSFYANWLGFLSNLDATLDLGEIKNFSTISVSFLQVSNHVVFFPTSVEFEISEDGQHFEKVATINNKFPLTKESKINDIQNFTTNPSNLKARYVRVIGNNMSSPPYWHHAAGTGAWIFADEIIIN